MIHEHYCRHFCPHISAQLHELESAGDEETVIPARMCPTIASLVIIGAAENITSSEADSYVEKPGADTWLERNRLLASAAKISEGYKSLADRCVRKMVTKGSDAVEFEEVVTIPSSEVASAIVNITRQSSD